MFGGGLKNLFMIFITFKTRDKTYLKIEKAWFLLVHWVTINSRLILLCHFRSPMSFFPIFLEKTVICKKCNFFGQTLVFLPTGKPSLYFLLSIFWIKTLRKTPVLESLFNYVAGLRSVILIKKRQQHRYFPVNFSRFLRTSISYNTCNGSLRNHVHESKI